MTVKPEYRFAFQIVDESTDEVVESDFCTITNARIGEFGDCEMVDMAVGKMLRNWRTFAREEHEATDETALARH